MPETNRATFPSSEFPDVPTVELDAPSGWVGRQVPGTLLALVLDRGPESFSPNVVVTQTRGTDAAWERAEAAVDEYVRSLAEVELAPRERIVLGGRRWSVLEFAHVIDGVGTVLQIIAITLVEHGAVVDTIRATSTITADQVEDALPQARATIASIRITER